MSGWSDRWVTKLNGEMVEDDDVADETLVAKKGTELMINSAILSFVFMAIKADGENSVELICWIWLL